MTVRTAALAAALALSACSANRLGETTMPIGVVLAPDDRGKPVVDGIYPSSGQRDDPCCWMGARARMRVQKDDRATDLALEVFVPDIELFRRHPQTVVVSIDGGPAVRSRAIAPGHHTILVPLPAPVRARTGIVEVTLRPGETFVPARVGLGADTRTLGVFLISVTFRSF